MWLHGHIPARWRWGRFNLAPMVIVGNMRNNIAGSFVRNGTRYFIPTKSAEGQQTVAEGGRLAIRGEKEWERLKDRILNRWQPNAAFSTLAKRAHVAAVRTHYENKWLAVIDLNKFFDHVTRAKIFRALLSIGFSQSEAFRIAGQSTVRQDEKYTLPRGFRQSSLLATLVLEKSLFGSMLTTGRFESTITVYGDDIIFSSNDFDILAREHSAAIELLRVSNFPINPAKTQTARREVEIFNFRVSQRSVRFTDQRMWKFVEQAASSGHAEAGYLQAFGDYVRSIDPEQEERLRFAAGVGRSA